MPYLNIAPKLYKKSKHYCALSRETLVNIRNANRSQCHVKYYILAVKMWLQRAHIVHLIYQLALLALFGIKNKII